MNGLDVDLFFISYEACFYLSGYVNSHIDRLCAAKNPHIFYHSRLHDQKVGVKRLHASLLLPSAFIRRSAVSRKGEVDSLMGQQFHSDDGVKAAILDWFPDPPTSFFADVICNLPKQ
ncbi:hypothetical protein TNCV_3534461 [Trichonephila clavipes]|nr:hypothetical protein TNCV_3534461 [Trichonephila clavipes]